MIFQKVLLKSLRQGLNNIAIVDAHTSFTYQEVLESANMVTHQLLKNNTAHGTYVGIVVDNRAHFIMSMIGIMNAGCVFVPIDGTLPISRLKEMASQLELDHLITSNGDLFEGLDINHLYALDAIFETQDQTSISYPSYDENDSIYVYFTSGSTGVPKGVVGKNKSLTQFIQWEIEEFKIDTTFRVSQFVSPFFDAFLRDVFVPLVAGATIVIPPNEDDFFTPNKMIDWIDVNEISLIHCVPSVFRVFAHKGIIRSDLFSSLQYVLMSGEKIVPGELNIWFETFKDSITLVNLYGTTETTMIRSFYRILPSDTKKARMPIGQPIYDTELLILNKDMKKNALLIPGDLYIVSNYMTKGYLKNPELTAEKFMEVEPNKLGFKTGDKARLLPDGTIELLGREDRQVKVRGIRVELDEIESLVRASDMVDHAVVINHKDKNSSSEQSEMLVCFAIRNGTALDDTNWTEELQVSLLEEIPSYMMPSLIIEVDSFPYLTSGKIDYKSLASKLEEMDKTMIPPSNEIETMLMEIWSGILKKESISTDDSFLKIGGNSLSLMQLIAKIYSKFEVRIPLGEIFKNLSISQQANFILNSQQVVNHYEIKKAEQKSLYSLSSAQQRMYINYDLNRDNISYNMPAVVEITGALQHQKIEKVMKELIKRDESLRTIFIVNEEGVFQQIVEDPTFILEEIEVPQIDDGIQDYIRPFNLNKEIPFRAAILNTQKEQYFLIMDVHHIVCDGVSQRNFFRDFLLCYNEQELEPLAFQFKDYAEWESTFSETEAYTSQKAFWLKSFDKAVAPLELPKVSDVDPAKSNTGANMIFSVDPGHVKPVLDQLKDDNITPFAVFYTYVTTLLLQYTGQEDFVVGLGTSGRAQEEIQDNIGMFVKTLPIRYEFELHKSFRTIAKELNNHLMGAINNELYDLGDIFTELNKRVQGSGDNLFNVMFTYLNYDFDEMSPIGQDFQPFNFNKSEVKFPMNFVVSEPNNFNSAYEIAFEYNHSYFTEEEAKNLVDSFKKLIEDVPAFLDRKIYDLVVEEKEVLNTLEDDITFNF